jgi:hypothetical protein
MTASRSSSKITRKLNLQPIPNIEIILTQIESQLGVLDVVEKLVKDAVHLYRTNFEKNNNFFFLRVVQT